MDFIYVTNFEIKTLSDEFKRINTINHINLDFLERIETKSPIPFVVYGDFTMCNKDFTIADLKVRFVVNSTLNRIEHVSDIILTYADDQESLEEFLPF